MLHSKILIIDDTIDNLKLMVSFFDKHHPDYDIYQTIISENALEIAIKAIPDIIITDWGMPVVSRIELIKQLKNETITKNIPVIIATGVMLTSVDLQIALDAGAFDPIELMARTNSALSIADYHKKVF